MKNRERSGAAQRLDFQPAAEQRMREMVRECPNDQIEQSQLPDGRFDEDTYLFQPSATSCSV